MKKPHSYIYEQKKRPTILYDGDCSMHDTRSKSGYIFILYYLKISFTMPLDHGGGKEGD